MCQQYPNIILTLYSFLIVMDKDNEENAEIAIKTLYEMQKFYRNTHFVIVSPLPRLMIFLFRTRYPPAVIASLRLLRT